MSIQVITPPPSFDANAWRLQLAGLTDPDYSTGKDDNRSKEEHKQWAINLCLACCELFGEDLDRMTLWDRIPSAMATASVKCGDGDIDQFVSLCLDHIKADSAKAARNDRVVALLMGASDKPITWRQGLVRYIVQHSFAIVAYGRRDWEVVKNDRKNGGEA